MPRSEETLKKEPPKPPERKGTTGEGKYWRVPETQSPVDLKWTSDDHSAPTLHQPPRKQAPREGDIDVYIHTHTPNTRCSKNSIKLSNKLKKTNRQKVYESG